MDIKPATWALVERFAKEAGITNDSELRILHIQLDAQVVDGNVSWLSAEWQQLARTGPLPDPPGLANIDLRKLHKSDRVKSGYVGVYQNKHGFRAVGPKGAYIGTYPSPELAAWERLRYYRKNNLPYGNLEEDIAKMRADGERGTDAQLKEILLEHAQRVGTSHLYEEELEDEKEEAYRPPMEMLGFGDESKLKEALAKLRRHDEANEGARYDRVDPEERD